MTNKLDENGLLPCREAFENFLVENNVHPMPETMRKGNNYKLPYAQMRWEAWQAAWNAQPIDKADESVRDVDGLAQFIRITNGDNKMGAGQLAEKICEYLSQPKQSESVEGGFIFKVVPKPVDENIEPFSLEMVKTILAESTQEFDFVHIEAEKLRKERDELAAYILEFDDSCRTLFGDDAHTLAKKVTENGNA